MTDNKKSVLIVEDEVPMLNILSDTLQGAGFITFKAKNGQEGLSLAQSSRPDLVLLDVLMPKMDGITMLSKLREAEWGKKIPVVILTNVSADTDATIKAIVDYQPAYYLVKSDIKLETILEKIQEVLASPTPVAR